MLQLLTDFQTGLTIFFLGSTSMMLLFAILQWVQIRDHSMLIYAAACVFMLAFCARNTGIMHPLSESLGITEAALWRYTENTLGLGICSSYILFVYHFLNYGAHFSKRVLWPLWIYLGGFAIILLLDWYFLFLVGNLQDSANLQWYAQLFILPPQVYMLLLGFRLKNVLSRIIISGYLASHLFLSVFLVYLAFENPTLSFYPPEVVPSPEYQTVISGIQLSFLMENVFFLYAFVYRIRIFQNERDKAYRDLWLKQQETKHLWELETQKDRFFTNISHEFRTPLAVILGSAEQLIGNTDQKQRIERNGRQLLHMVNQILELSKLHAGLRKPEWAQCDVIAFLKYLADPFRSMALSKKQSFVFHAELSQLLMDFDPEMLRSIFINLVDNALKFTPQYGEVKVIVSRDERRLILRVEDSGSGIAAEDLPRIFDRHYYTPFSDKKGGAGIGLSLVREYSELLGGKVEVDSREGNGAVFTVCLPIHREAKPTEILRPDTALPLLPANGHDKIGGDAVAADERPRVLIIDDNPDVISYLSDILQEHYQLRHARNGKTGLALLRENAVDLVLCDVMMPEMDGLEVCRAIREAPSSRHLPLIMITARATQADKLKGLEAGADAYLTKPFDLSELRLQIDNLLKAYGRMPEEARENEQQAILKKLDAVIEANIDNELFNVYYLCREMHMARPTLNKKVKAVTGLPPGEYLKRKRLLYARRLLENSEMNVSEVAREVGYKTLPHFSSAFKAHFGISPADTRK